MNHFLILINFTFLFNTLTAQTFKNDWQKLTLNGKPKILVIENGVQKPITYVFNKFGNIIQKKNECLCTNADNTTDYYYSAKNRLLQKTTRVEGEIVQKIKYVYDANGKESEIYLIGEEVIMAIESEYVIGQKEVNSYDDSKNLIKVSITYPYNNEISVVEYHYKYDNQKNWVQKDTYNKMKGENELNKKESILRKIIYF